MQKAPLVSVVIITYNQEEYLKQTIDSVLAQETEYDYEIVIGEDCSTDNTREIVYSYQRQYPDKIRVITSDKNVGLLDNYCRTVKAARGKYIACCAGDDYWHNPEKTQKQVKFLEENPDCGMVHSEADFLYEDTGHSLLNAQSALGHYCDNIKENILEQVLDGTYQIIVCTAIFRKDLFDAYFDINELKRNDIIMEDTPLCIEIAAHSNIYYMPDSFVTHREMNGTISNPVAIEGKIKFYQSGYKCLIYFYNKYCYKLHNKDNIIKKIHAGNNRCLLNLAIKAKDLKLARKSYTNIVEFAGKDHLTIKDKLSYMLTYFPFGPQFYYFIKRIKDMRKR